MSTTVQPKVGARYRLTKDFNPSHRTGITYTLDRILCDGTIAMKSGHRGGLSFWAPSMLDLFELFEEDESPVVIHWTEASPSYTHGKATGTVPPVATDQIPPFPDDRPDAMSELLGLARALNLLRGNLERAQQGLREAERAVSTVQLEMLSQERIIATLESLVLRKGGAL